MKELELLTEQDLKQQILEWKKHPITVGILTLLKEEMEAYLLDGIVPHGNSHSSFDYDVGYKDGKLTTIYNMLKPELWLYNSLDKGDIDE